MRKNPASKLSLSKETLRRLTDKDSALAQGGAKKDCDSLSGNSWNVFCVTEVSCGRDCLDPTGM